MSAWGPREALSRALALERTAKPLPSAKIAARSETQERRELTRRAGTSDAFRAMKRCRDVVVLQLMIILMHVSNDVGVCSIWINRQSPVKQPKAHWHMTFVPPSCDIFGLVPCSFEHAARAFSESRGKRYQEGKEGNLPSCSFIERVGHSSGGP